MHVSYNCQMELQSISTCWQLHKFVYTYTFLDLQTQSQVIAISSYFTVDFLHPFNKNPCVVSNSAPAPQAANPFGNSLKPVAGVGEPGSMRKPLRKKIMQMLQDMVYVCRVEMAKEIMHECFKTTYLNVCTYIYSGYRVVSFCMLLICKMSGNDCLCIFSYVFLFIPNALHGCRPHSMLLGS